MKDYHKLIEEIYHETDGSIDWLVNSLLSRSNYLSSVFIDLCYLELVKKVAEKEQIEKVICKTPAQRKILKQYFLSVSRKIQITSTERPWQRFRRLITPYHHFLRNIKSALRFMRHRSKVRRDLIPKKNEITIIDMFFIPSMFKHGFYEDRYFPGLLDQIPEAIRKKVYFVPHILDRTKLKQALNIADEAREQFLYKFDFLKFQDYLFALFSPFRLKKIDLHKFTFRSLNIGPILQSDFRKSMANSSSFQGILNYRFFQRLQQEDVRLRLVINWFENQVIDRGFNKGKSDFYPNTQSIGYQGFIMPLDLKPYSYATDLEFNTGQIPDRIAVVGNSLINDAKKYCSMLDVVSAPAFRFADMYKQNFNDLYKSEEMPIILIALPIAIQESIDIMLLTIDAYRTEAIGNIHWLIKPHPSLNIERLKMSMPHWPEVFEIADGNFAESILQADLMVGNASSTTMEALAYGVPVIIAGSRSGMMQNPFPNSVPKAMWDLCYTVDEFNAALRRLLFEANDDLRRKQAKIGKKIRTDYFEPVTKEGALRFLYY